MIYYYDIINIIIFSTNFLLQYYNIYNYIIFSNIDLVKVFYLILFNFCNI